MPGGNCMTAMIATISLEILNLGETISTCRFAGRVACIANAVSWVDFCLPMPVTLFVYMCLTINKKCHCGSCKTPVTPEWRPYSVPTAFKKNCRTPRCALCKRQQRCGNAVQSPRTPCGGVYFDHAQNKLRSLVFPQRVRQHAVATLWGFLERRGRVVSEPRARCKDAV